jgi:oligosaccharide repeat unit polymerase
VSLGAGETALWVTTFLLGAACASVLSVRAGRGWINPVAVYSGVWSLLVLTISLGVVDVGRLAQSTWWLVTVSATAFSVGCFVAWGLVGIAGTSSEGRDDSQVVLGYDDERLRRYYWLAVAALFGYVAIQVAKVLPLLRSAGGLEGIISGGGLTFRRAQIEAAAENATTSFSGGSFLIGIAGYVLFIGMIAIFWAGYFARLGRWGAAATPLVLLAAFSLFALQRFFFVYGVALFCFSYAYHRWWSAGDRARAGRLPALLLVGLIAAVVLVPIALRQPVSSSEQALGGPVDYFVSGLAGLNTLVTHDISGPAPQPGLGVWTFWGVSSLLSRGGVPLAMPETSALFYVDIGQEHSIQNNVYTYLIYPLYDLGWFGLIALPLMFGMVSGRLHYAVVVSRRLELVPAVCIAMSSILMSFFSLSLIRDTRWLFLAVASVGLRGLVMTVKSDEQHSEAE